MVDHGTHCDRHAALTNLLELPDESDTSSMSMSLQAPPLELQMLDDTAMVSPHLELDIDQDLTGNFSQLSMQEAILPDMLQRRVIAGREALWEAPEDPVVLGRSSDDENETDDDDDDVEIQREWVLQEDADTYNIRGDEGELTAAEILDGKFISAVYRAHSSAPCLCGAAILRPFCSSRSNYQHLPPIRNQTHRNTVVAGPDSGLGSAIRAVNFVYAIPFL
jgi:hypothetical protein